MPPPTSKARQRAAGQSEPDITIRVDGVTYAIRSDDLTARDARDLRKQTGMSFRAVMEAATEDPDIDIMAALVFLARRQDGDRKVTFDEIAEAITYSSEMEVGEDEDGEKLEPPEEDPDSPEASGVD